MQVEARFGGEEDWYPGTVKAVNADGTYQIAYDDGDEEDSVAPEYVRLRPASRRPKFRVLPRPLVDGRCEEEKGWGPNRRGGHLLLVDEVIAEDAAIRKDATTGK